LKPEGHDYRYPVFENKNSNCEWIETGRRVSIQDDSLDPVLHQQSKRLIQGVRRRFDYSQFDLSRKTCRVEPRQLGHGSRC
jgi:hypothetical protein